MAPKRKSKNTAAAIVVNTITESEALPPNLRSLLSTILPAILNTNKLDRHAYEAEVVEHASEALTIVGKAIEAAHSESLVKQNAIISPAERIARGAAEKQACEKETQAHSQVEACDAAKKEADKGVHDAEHSLKVAQKEEAAAEKLVAKTTQKKSTLEAALTNGFVSLTAGATKSEKDAAVRQIAALAKENGVGSTLLQAFGLACKTEASSRSEFEATTLATVKAKLDEALQAISNQLGEESAIVEKKKAEIAAAKEALASAEESRKIAIETLSAAKESQKEAKKKYSQAAANTQNVWEEMKIACDYQDELAKAVKNYKEVIMPAFEEAREKVAVVEELTPAEEPPEKKQKTCEEEAAAPETAPATETLVDAKAD